MTTYNHTFTVEFTVISENDGPLVTKQEILDGIANRLHNLIQSGDADEAVGLPIDTFIDY